MVRGRLGLVYLALGSRLGLISTLGLGVGLGLAYVRVKA